MKLRSRKNKLFWIICPATYFPIVFSREKRGKKTTKKPTTFLFLSFGVGPTILVALVCGVPRITPRKEQQSLHSACKFWVCLFSLRNKWTKVGSASLKGSNERAWFTVQKEPISLSQHSEAWAWTPHFIFIGIYIQIETMLSVTHRSYSDCNHNTEHNICFSSCMASNHLAKIYAYILPRANSSALSNQMKCKNQELYIPSI